MAVAIPSTSTSSNWHNFRMDEDSDDEFQKNAEDHFSGRSALLIIIDATPSMFLGWGNQDKDSPFLAALKCCESILRSKIISNPKDLVRIVLNGTGQSRNSNFPNICGLHEFSNVTVDMIKQLMDMRDSEDLLDFENQIGSSSKYDLKNLFWQAKMDFDIAKTQTYWKKLMYFTCEDNPHADQPNLQADVATKFKDLGKVDFNIISFKEGFDLQKFYSKLVDDESSVIYCTDVEKLQKIVRMKERLKRPISRSTLEIAPGLKLGIGFYSFARKAAHPKEVCINRRNNEKLERTVNVFRSESGMPVLKSEEQKMANVQGEKVVFTDQEIKTIKTGQEPGVTILGYMMARDFDNLLWYRSPCYFLYPDEERIKGSKELFTMLLQRVLILERVIVVRFVLTRGKSPKLGILIPSVPDETSKDIFPQGFHIFPIPFSDEVRKYKDLDGGPEAAPELVALMEKVVKRLTNTNFDIMDVKDPSLQCKWRQLEEEALDEKIEDAADLFDYTEPNEELMNKRLKTIPGEIEENATELSKTFKSAKASIKPPPDIENEARHGRLMNCTCAQMRAYLMGRGVDCDRLKIYGKYKLMDAVTKGLC